MRVRGLALILLVAIVGCSSAWEKHSLRLREAQSARDWDKALAEQHWLIDHAFQVAPPEEQGKGAEVDRYLNLAAMAAEAGHEDEAVEILRVALRTDPTRYPAIVEHLARVPLSERDRKRVEAEFRWNRQVLLPSAEVPNDGDLPCWSYRAREVRMRRQEVRMGLGASERRVSYDARAWLYDADSGSWRADGDWVEEVGAETERVSGPPQPRYRAVIAADGGFLVDGPVPPCHRHQWTGPFDSARAQLFVAQRLPRIVP